MNRFMLGVSKALLTLIVVVAVVSTALTFILLNRRGEIPQSVTTGSSLSLTTSLSTSQVSNQQKFLRIGIGIDADTLDPAGQTTTTVSNIVRFMVESLFTIDVDGSVKPLLAESYEVSTDGKEYLIKLRKNVRFQDGTPFNATAVKLTFERLLDPNVNVPARAYYKIIQKVEVIDTYTVKFILKEPYAPFITVLAFTQSGILSPKAVFELGSKISTAPQNIGTGPYKFKEWVKGDRIVLVRNDNYWNGTPYFSELVFKVVPDAQTRTAMLLAGDLDLIIQPPATDVNILRQRSDVKVVSVASNRVMFIGINTQWGPFKDVRVRRALNYAVDKEAIVKNVLFGLGQVMDSVLPTYSLGYVKLGPYTYDPAKAKELLKEAGYPNGFKVTLVTPSGRYLFDKQVAEAIAQDLRKIGLEVEVRTYDWPTYVSILLAPLNKTELQLFLLGWSPGSPDPHFYLYQRFHSTQFTPNGFNNFFYANAEVDKLLDEGVKVMDFNLRVEIYRNVSKLIWEDAPNIFLYIQYFVVAYRADLTGVKVYPYEMIDVIQARLSS